MPVVTRSMAAAAEEKRQKRIIPTSIALMKLPFLVQESVIRNVHPFQIFNFSCLSKKALDVACLARTRVESLKWTFDEGITLIHIQKSEETLFKIVVAERYISREAPQFIKLDGAVLKVFTEEDCKRVIISGNKYHGPEKKHVVDVVSEYLLKLFVPTIFQCHIFNITAAREFLKNNCPFEKVHVANIPTLSSEDMDFLNELDTKWLILNNCTVVAEGKYVKPLKHKKVSIYNDPGSQSWLSVESILNMETVNLAILYGGFTIEDAKSIMEKCWNGGLGQLRSLSLEEEVDFNQTRDYIERRQAELQGQNEHRHAIAIQNELFLISVLQN